ncbi:MAG TPA: FAD binding domain-containing protein [Alphaproteobacteria bacterium]|nr:FAD binding domain-containing protein [Alphaproteobacteria bacterium]
MGDYFRPTRLEEALAALADKPRTVLAGGTDFYPARVGRPLADDVLDITGLAALKGIGRDAAGWRIGCLASWSDLIAAALPPAFDGLKAAAREVGGVQIQNAGTICGNVCNASPAADGVPNLLVLDAVVELAALGGERKVPLRDFIVGNRKTVLRPDELVTALLIPAPAPSARSRFLKLGARRYLVISIVMAAALLEASADGRVAVARVAVGACSAVACRLAALEAALVGRALDGRLGEGVTPEHLAPLRPIDDIRGTAAYRRDATLTVLRRLLSELGGGA